MQYGMVKVVKTHTGKIYVDQENKLEFLTVGDYGDVHQLIRMLYKKDKEVERLRSTLMEIATKYNIPVDDIDEL